MSPRIYHQLENFGVDTIQLNQAATHRVFRAWVEDWEEEAIYKNFCVAEACLLENYRDLAFYDPDDKVTCTVYSKNLEWVKKLEELRGLGIYENFFVHTLICMMMINSNHLGFQTWL